MGLSCHLKKIRVSLMIINEKLTVKEMLIN